MRCGLRCLVGGREVSVPFDSMADLEVYARRLGLRRVAAYRSGGTDVVQCSEPDFEAMGPSERARYGLGLGTGPSIRWPDPWHTLRPPARL